MATASLRGHGHTNVCSTIRSKGLRFLAIRNPVICLFAVITWNRQPILTRLSPRNHHSDIPNALLAIKTLARLPEGSTVLVKQSVRIRVACTTHSYIFLKYILPRISAYCTSWHLLLALQPFHPKLSDALPTLYYLSNPDETPGSPSMEVNYVSSISEMRKQARSFAFSTPGYCSSAH